MTPSMTVLNTPAARFHHGSADVTQRKLSEGTIR